MHKICFNKLMFSKVTCQLQFITGSHCSQKVFSAFELLFIGTVTTVTTVSMHTLCMKKLAIRVLA